MLDELDHTLRDPLYLQLKNALVKAIREGRFGWPGAALACVLSSGDLRPLPAASLTSPETMGQGA